MQDVQIRRAESEADICAVRELWSEYWKALSLPPEFQGFDKQLNSLPGEFGRAGGILLIALNGESVLGTIALRRLNEQACEVKRLYVRPESRGQKVGRALLDAVIENAKAMQYRAIYMDTLPSMTVAVKLYEAQGFERVEAYSEHPTPGAVYLRLRLVE